MNKMITRTIKTLEVLVEYADMEQKAIREVTVTIPYCKQSQVEKKASEQLLVPHKVLSAKVLAGKETIYGMEETEFLRIAKPVIRGNNGTAKPVEEAVPEQTVEGGDSHGQINEPDAIAEKKARKLNMNMKL